MTSPLAPLDVAASASASVVASTATASASATPVLDSVSTFVNLASGFCRAGLKFWKPSQLVKLASQLISPQLREAFINDAPAEDPLSVSCADWGMTRLSQDSPFSNVIYVFEVLGPADELAKQVSLAHAPLHSSMCLRLDSQSRIAETRLTDTTVTNESTLTPNLT